MRTKQKNANYGGKVCQINIYTFKIRGKAIQSKLISHFTSKDLTHNKKNYILLIKTILLTLVNYFFDSDVDSAGGLIISSWPPSFWATVAAFISLQWLMNLLTSWLIQRWTKENRDKYFGWNYITMWTGWENRHMLYRFLCIHLVRNSSLLT